MEVGSPTFNAYNIIEIGLRKCSPFCRVDNQGAYDFGFGDIFKRRNLIIVDVKKCVGFTNEANEVWNDTKEAWVRKFGYAFEHEHC